MALATPLLQKDIGDASSKAANPLAGTISPGFTIHLLVEIWNAPFSALADAESVRSILEQAVSVPPLGGTESNRVRTFQFNPYGVSATATNSAVHILIHTWPEKGYAAIDIFSRTQGDAHKALERMKNRLNPENIHIMELTRGKLLDMEDT